MSEFIQHATFQTSNWGGVEIELSEDGYSVRARETYGQDEEPEVSDWLEVKYREDSIGLAYFVLNGTEYDIGDFMVRDF